MPACQVWRCFKLSESYIISILSYNDHLVPFARNSIAEEVSAGTLEAAVLLVFWLGKDHDISTMDTGM